MGDKALASFRENFQNLKVLIIDEVSLLGSDMLYKIHLRLNEVLGGNFSFGGIAVILVGDLLQLAPVKASYIFDKPRNPHFAAYHDVNPLWMSFESMILKWNHRQGKNMLYHFKELQNIKNLFSQAKLMSGPIFSTE